MFRGYVKRRLGYLGVIIIVTEYVKLFFQYPTLLFYVRPNKGLPSVSPSL